MTAAQARRTGLAAQGFGRASGTTVGIRQVTRELQRVGQFQIDSVSVFVRAHHMPVFARLGPYDRRLVDRLVEQAPRRGYEYWGHAACIIDVELEPAFRWRAEASRAKPWGSAKRLIDERPGLIEQVHAQVAERGPVTARELDDKKDGSGGGWWSWSQVKTALEWLFVIGEVTSAGRTPGFERRYALPHHVLPQTVRALPTPSPDEARVRLARRAAAAMGVFTHAWLAEYFYTDKASTGRALDHLLSTGEVEPVDVTGWDQPAYLWADAARPRRIHHDGLVAPFDSLAYDRRRLATMFGVEYRIGLYTPKAQRTDGYYVYLFVMDDRIAARVDLKADRATSRLLVQASWLEADAPEVETAARLAAELRRAADWLELTSVQVEPRGTLAERLATHL
jgi:uncharacterized protein